MGPFGEEVINDNGDKLIDVREQNSLKILNGYFKHKKIHQYTWHQDTLHNLFLVHLSISTCFGQLCAHHQEKQLCLCDICV